MMRGAAKVRFAMTSRTSSAAISLVAFFGFWPALYAQQAKIPTLEEILRRLEANLNHYDTSVPSVFCDEHVISQMEPGPRDQDRITDSVFHLKRTANSNHTTTLVESREIKKVNGEPATSQDMDGPTLLNGAFEGGLAVVSLNQAVCMNYDLQPIKRRHATKPYIVNFATALTPQNLPACLLHERSNGRVFIDPTSMQITHLELTTPHHVISPGNSYTDPIVGKRVLTVDYVPVSLGDDTFWMPSTITLRATSGSGSFHMTVWSFRANYSDYHRLEVKSRILPASKAPAS
jgi:hypothetical protein